MTTILPVGKDEATGCRRWADWECGPMPGPCPGHRWRCREKGEQPGLCATGLAALLAARHLRRQEAGAPWQHSRECGARTGAQAVRRKSMLAVGTLHWICLCFYLFCSRAAGSAAAGFLGGSEASLLAVVQGSSVSCCGARLSCGRLQ